VGDARGLPNWSGIAIPDAVVFNAVRLGTERRAINNKMNELKKALQDHFRDGLVTIVGSGLSCAEGLPGMGELGDHLRAQIGPELQGSDPSLWQLICDEMGKIGLESALLKHPPTPSLEAAIVAITASLIADRERDAIREVFDGKRVLRLTRLLPHILKPAGGLPIITPNYDRLVEVASEEAELGVDTMFLGRFAGRLDPVGSRHGFCKGVVVRARRPMLEYRPRVNVLKPHGSLDWFLRAGKPVAYGGELPGATRLIITPGQNKFRNGYDSPFDVHRERANAAIDHAARFLIIGYGFADGHLETHLEPAIRAGRPTLMLTHGLSAKALEFARQFKNVVAIDCTTKPDIGSRVIRDGEESIVPIENLWDLHTFIDEVLEP